MAQQIYQGYIYEADPQTGEWVRVGPAPQAAPVAPQRQGMVIQNPTAAAEVSRAGSQATISGYDARRAAAEDPYVPTVAAAQAQKAAAEAQKAQIEANQAASAAATKQSPEQRKYAESLKTDNLLNTINRARQQIGQGRTTGTLFGTGLYSSIPLIGQDSRDLAGTLDTLKAIGVFDQLQQMRNSSPTGAALGAVSDADLRLLSSSIASLDQAQSDEQLFTALATIEGQARRLAAVKDGLDPRDPEVAAAYGIVLSDAQPPAATPPNSPPPSGGQLTSDIRTTDAALAGADATVRDMVQRGYSAADIRAYLDRLSPGLGQQASGIDEAVAYAAQYPDRASEINVDLESKWQPAPGMRAAIGELAMSPIGTGIIGAADMATLGMLDNLTANPEMSRAVMAGAQAENPTSYLLGQIGGGVATGLGLEAGLGRLGLQGLNAVRGGEIGMGAAYGAGSADDPEQSRVANALLGAGVGLAGGAAGRGLVRGVGGVLTGATNSATRALAGAGVPLTPGQIAGGALRATEDKLTSLPVVGDAIKARRMEGIEGFNKAAFNEALSPIGKSVGDKTGGNAVSAAHDIVSEEYGRVLGNKNLRVDTQFLNEIQTALIDGGSIPNLGEAFQDTVKRRVLNLIDNGNISGERFRQSLSGMRESTAKASKEVQGADFEAASSAIEDALLGLASRQAPELASELDAVNSAYRNLKTIDRATMAATNQPGEMFMPSQLRRAGVTNTRQYGGEAAAASGNIPMGDLSRAGQDVLPSTIPDSGTAGRLFVPFIGGLAAGGGNMATNENATAGGSLATGALVAAALAAPYSQAGQRLFQTAAMAPRAPIVVKAGEAIKDKADIASLLTAPLAIEYAVR